MPYPGFPNQSAEDGEQINQTDFRSGRGRGALCQPVISALSAPRHPISGTHSTPSSTGAEIPKTERVWHQPGTGCGLLLGSRDQRLGSFPRRVHPAQAHSPRLRPARGQPSAQRERVGAPCGLPGFKVSLPEPPGALAPFVSGVGAKGQKTSPSQASRAPALCGKGRPGGARPALARLGRPESSPRRGLGRVPREGGGLGGIRAPPTSPVALAEGEGRTEGHSPSGRRPGGSGTQNARLPRCRGDAGASLKVALGRG